ncbi:hypothetical protein [Lentzea sp. NPDC004782]
MTRALVVPLGAMILMTGAGAVNAAPAPVIAWAPCADNPEGRCGESVC